MWHTYVLESLKDGDRYVGITNDLRKRLATHNAGKAYATKERVPFKIIYIETMISKYDAARREKFLKTGWGKNYLDRVMESYYASKS